jgi:hypothetical protein
MAPLTALKSLPLVNWSLAMTFDQMAYHRQRAQHCRDMAESATDPDVRRRHEELAQLHASRSDSGSYARP